MEFGVVGENEIKKKMEKDKTQILFLLKIKKNWFKCKRTIRSKMCLF